MNERLTQFIQYKTGGKMASFARLMGWTPQYLAKLVGGRNFGLSPVVAILKENPELNARWLLLGEGEMIRQGHTSELRSMVFAQVQRMIDLERYMVVMSDAELHDFEQHILSGNAPVYDYATISRWKEALDLRNAEMDARFNNALKTPDHADQ